MKEHGSYSDFLTRSAIILWLALSVCFSANAQKSIPELWGLHVHDEAHVLSSAAVDRLEHKLNVYEDSTSNQLAILVINSLDGDVLEEYSLRVAEKWKLGQKEKDNGALLLVSVTDRKMRIETGQGLEGALTDAVCNQIIRKKLAPSFRKDDYDEGIEAGIDAMISAIGGEYTASDEDGGSAELSWKEKLGLGAFIFGVLGIFTFIGIISPGCAGWFLYAFLIPFYAAFPMVVFSPRGGITALLIYLIGYPIAKLFIGRSDWGKRMTKKMGTSGSGGGWSRSGGWSGGGWSSGGGGGGGFSGGGGSFGGGGSSGSW